MVSPPNLLLGRKIAEAREPNVQTIVRGVSRIDLERVKNIQYLYLTTRGRKTGNKHTVQLWFAYAEGKIYLSHDGAYTDWMKNLAKDGAVSFKIRMLALKGNAKIVEEGNPREIGRKALYEKYYRPASREVIDDWFSLSTVIQVTPTT